MDNKNSKDQMDQMDEIAEEEKEKILELLENTSTEEIDDSLENFKFKSFEIIKVKSNHRDLAHIDEVNFSAAFLKVYIKISRIIDLRVQKTCYYTALQAIMSVFFDFKKEDEESDAQGSPRALNFLFALLHKSQIKNHKNGKEYSFVRKEMINNFNLIDIVILATQCFMKVSQNDEFLPFMTSQVIHRFQNEDDIFLALFNSNRKKFSGILLDVITGKGVKK